MKLELASLSTLQRELLQAALAQGSLVRAKGGYVSHPGAKPFNLRTVMALQRMELLSLSKDTSRVAITSTGSQLLLHGQVELSEQLAG